jgi:PAS domain-containing protein
MHSLIKTYGLDTLVINQDNQDFSRLDNLPVAIYATDINGNITYYNRAAVILWGRAPVKGNDKWCGGYDLYTTDGRFIVRDNCAMALAVKEGKALRGVEAIARRPDGTAFRFLPFPTPLYDDQANLVGAVNMVINLGEVEMNLPESEIDFLHVST